MTLKNCSKKPAALLKKARFAPIALVLGLFIAGCTLPEGANPTLPEGKEIDEPSDSSAPQVTPNGPQTTYLGYGYDVVKSSYVNRGDVIMSNPILDQKKLTRDNKMASDPMAEQYFKLSIGSSVKKFYSSRNSSLGLGIDLSGLEYFGALFSGKFGWEFNVSDETGRLDTNSYLRGHSYVYTRDEYITGMSAQILSEYMTDGFIADLGTIGTTRTADQFLDRYGTHAIVRYYKGGSLEFNYAYYGSKLKEDREKIEALNASFYVIKGEASTTEKQKSSELDNNSTFHYYTRGGKAINAFKIEELRSNYGEGLNAIENNADICGIGNFDNCFIPVWELAEAAGLSSKGKELESAFIRRAIAAGKALLVKKIRSDATNYNYSSTFTFNKAGKDSPAEIEVYALGAGGGGQGGAKKSGILDNFTATGGSGGGGAAAYMKLTINKPVDFNIVVGMGGAGGSPNSNGLGSSGESGDPGAKGGNTSVTWSSESITLTAGGGMGGGGITYYVDGGTGGSFTLPSAPNTIIPAKGGKCGNEGKPGEPGDLRSSAGTQGGSAGTIDKNIDDYSGSLSSFGGGAGAVRQGGGNRRAADIGGGGCGGYGTDYPAGYGLDGGNGEVRIIVRYFTEE